ncbi:hypothetical protein R6Q59_034922 [Mikania micrantha]
MAGTITLWPSNRYIPFCMDGWNACAFTDKIAFNTVFVLIIVIETRPTWLDASVMPVFHFCCCLGYVSPIIPDNAWILCITAAAGTELANAYSPDTFIASYPGKEVHDPWAFYLHAALLHQGSGPCLSPRVTDHPLEPATDHRLAYEVLTVITSCCSSPMGWFLRVTHMFATRNTTSCLTCMC